jgi:hypothetical protein
VAVHRSHATGTIEHIQRWFGGAHVYRCHACGWRGRNPTRRRRASDPAWSLNVAPPDFSALDAVAAQIITDNGMTAPVSTAPKAAVSEEKSSAGIPRSSPDEPE